MSTRAKIIVFDHSSRLYFYKHFDGYPNATLPVLNKFLNFVKEGRINDNTSQACGWLILLGAQLYDYYWEGSVKKKKTKKQILEPIKEKSCGAIEPFDEKLEFGVDYIYRIDLVKKEIFYVKA